MNTDTSSQRPTLEDEELLGRARSASNSEKFDRLWRGSITGYESQSEADMELCCLLAFWTGGDAARVDRLFRQSGLIREKWDDVHYSDGSTYGEKTVERAIANTDDVYDPSSERLRVAIVLHVGRMGFKYVVGIQDSLREWWPWIGEIRHRGSGPVFGMSVFNATPSCSLCQLLDRSRKVVVSREAIRAGGIGVV